MYNIKKAMRTTVLYTFSVILVGGVPMAAFADNSDACVSTGHLSDRWETDPTTNQCVKLYDENGTYVGPSYMAPPPPTPSPTPTPTPTPSPSPSPAAMTDGSAPTGTSATVQDSGASNTTGSNSTTTGTADTNTATNATVNNQVGTTGTSGNATVQGNSSSGGSTSGNATTGTTVVNNVQSTVGSSTGVATFTYDVNGNVTGDITITGPGSQAGATNTTNLNTNTTATNNAAITNTVDGKATSGDATVQGNSSTGSATTGNANAVAYILNLINTIIASNQSFVGTINIYGNLNGDILLSPQFIPQLIASNNGSTTSADNLALSTNLNNNTAIVNNVNLAATSGSATVQGNSTTGNASTGNTQTNLTILNLTGHTVNAADSLLVFVNVLGTWVGMIVNAPGATAAALGSGIVSNTTNLTSNTTLNNTAAITNNINLAAISGNALVNGNSSAGNATSGNATASANISNISTSFFNLTGWFGILYINVFGTWIGSFGVNTSAGTITPLGGAASPDTAGAIAAPALHFGFTPKNPDQLLSQPLPTTMADTPSAGGEEALLAAEQNMTPPQAPTKHHPQTSSNSQGYPFSIVSIAGFTVAGAGGALSFFRRNKK